MRRIIPLAETLLDQAEEFWQRGWYEEAKRQLAMLLGLRGLPKHIVHRAEYILGDIYLGEGQCRKARRHLGAALAASPTNAEAHFLMACAMDWDEECEDSAAWVHYKRAVELEPGQPLYSSAYALMRIRRLGKRAADDGETLLRLRESYGGAPDDPDVVHNYISGLIELGRYNEARLPLERARRLWPGQPAFELLVSRLRERESGRQVAEPAVPYRPSRYAVGAELVLVPFPSPRRRSRPPSRLRPNSRLRTSLQTLTDRQVVALAKRLGLMPVTDPAAMRQRLEQTLRSGHTLRSLLAGLSPTARVAIERLSRAGGSLEAKRLVVRIDPPAGHAPHIGLKRAPLNELCQTGLVYLVGRPASERPTARIAMIPADIREAVRAAVDEFEAAHSRSLRIAGSGN